MSTGPHAPAASPPSKGRPTKLTPAVQIKITTALVAGNFLETAAAYAGIHRDTLHDWLRKGAAELERIERDSDARPQEAPAKRTRAWARAVRAWERAQAERAAERDREAPFAAFSLAVEEALAQAEVAMVTKVTSAANDGNWKAASWRLERQYPLRWGRRVALTGAEGGPLIPDVGPDLGRLSDTDLAALEAILAKATAEPDASR